MPLKNNVLIALFLLLFLVVMALAVWRHETFVQDECEERGGHVVSGECEGAAR